MRQYQKIKQNWIMQETLMPVFVFLEERLGSRLYHHPFFFRNFLIFENPKVLSRSTICEAIRIQCFFC